MQGTYYETDRLYTLIIMTIITMIIYYVILRRYNPRKKKRYIQSKNYSKNYDVKEGK